MISRIWSIYDLMWERCLAQIWKKLYPIAPVNTSGFHYPAIDSRQEEIRLLRLFPGSQSQTIRGELLAVSLHDRPCYKALSYVWGDASDKKSISLSGRPFIVTANLEKALRSLRYYKKERLLWIDALCINQSDDKEKGQQIRKMRAIYHSAKQVLAWTGEADDESNEALDLLNYLRQPIVFMNLYVLSSNPETFRRTSFGNKWIKTLRFLNRPYWSRVWILQELAIPGTSLHEDINTDKIQVGVGQTWLPLSSFNLALQSFGRVERSLLSSPAYLDCPEWPTLQPSCAALGMFTVVQSCIKDSKRQRENIGTLLRQTHFLKATDPRDKIYALVALTRKKDHVLVPDYSLSTIALLRKLVHHLITVDENLEILSGNRRVPLASTGEWTSWVPDPERYIHTTRGDWEPETTSFKTCTSIAPSVSFSDDLRLLNVKGRVISRISTVIGAVDWTTFPGLTSRDLPQSSVMQCLQELEEFGASLSGPRREMFWRTLVLDSGELEPGRREYPAPREIGRWFEAMVSDSTTAATTETIDCCRKFYQQVGIIQRCFYTTDLGEMGVGPFDTLPGDLVVMLYGGQFCYILREFGDHYIFIGDSYLYGAMHGELLDPRGEWKGRTEERSFVLR
jgi:hypothetical protein